MLCTKGHNKPYKYSVPVHPYIVLCCCWINEWHAFFYAWEKSDFGFLPTVVTDLMYYFSMGDEFSGYLVDIKWYTSDEHACCVFVILYNQW